MTKYIFSFLLLFFSLNFGYSQNRIVKGLVIDEDLEPIGNFQSYRIIFYIVFTSVLQLYLRIQ